MTEQNKTDSVGDDVFVEKVNNLYEATYEDEVEPSCNPSDIEDLIKEIKKANTEWENIIMEERPLLPKLSCRSNKQTKQFGL